MNALVESLLAPAPEVDRGAFNRPAPPGSTSTGFKAGEDSAVILSGG